MALLADVILVVHLAFVLFVVGGLIAVPLGAALRWSAVRSFRLRVAHLGAIVFVAGEALVGVACPLTIWEDALRGRGTEGTFIERLVQGVLFYDLPDGVFAVAYLAAAFYTLLLWKTVPPKRDGTGRS